ncbi:MAG: nodulation protein NfeD [Desulfobacterium sp.]|nr:nodulation protein NfeD [Desulfobacterium sp.]
MKPPGKELVVTCLNRIWSTGFILVVLFFVFLPVQAKATADNTKVKVYEIKVQGPVEPGMAAFLKRALSSDQDPSSIFVLKMDTFGGRVDSALQIVELILNTPRGKTIAFVSDKAISAGALISLACNQLVMKHHTTIGDCAPIMNSSEGPKMMGEKFQSPLRAKFRSLAKRNNYSEVLAEAMVTDRMVVYRVIVDGETRYMDSREYDDLTDGQKKAITSKKTIVDKGELLTMDAVEAKELGFSRMTVDSVEEMLGKMEILNHEIIPVEENWAEAFVRFITKISPVLMMIGLGALYTEIKSPGFGVPGLVGIVCLGLVFAGQYLVGLADYTEFLLVIAGMILFGVEIFVLPGFGISGIVGLILMGAGLVLALQDFVLPDPSLPWQGKLLVNNLIQVLGASVAGLFLALATIRYLLPRLSVVVDGPYLSATLKDSHADSMEIRKASPGDRGVAVTFLRPSGKVAIRGELFDAVSQGEFIEKGSRIRVARIEGNRMIVLAEEDK